MEVVRGPDPFGNTVVAPLIVGGERIGRLAAFYGPERRLRPEDTRVVSEVASLVSAQVELSALAEQEERLAQAELRALRAQISPHFIYNALAAVANSIHTKPGGGARAADRVRRVHPLRVPRQPLLRDARRRAALRREVPAARAGALRRPPGGAGERRARGADRGRPGAVHAAAGGERGAPRRGEGHRPVPGGDPRRRPRRRRRADRARRRRGHERRGRERRAGRPRRRHRPGQRPRPPAVHVRARVRARGGVDARATAPS